MLRCFWLLPVLAVVFGCRSDPNAPRKVRVAQRIALIGVGKDHPTWEVLQAIAHAVAGRKSLLTIDVLAPDVTSPKGQQDILEKLPLSRVDAVCIYPNDPAAIAQSLRYLVTKGVPVVALGQDVASDCRSGYCGPLDNDIGRAAAMACESLVRGRSNSVMLLHAGSEDENRSARYASFKAFLPLAHGVTLLREVDCGGNRLEAVELVKSESRKYPRAAGWVFLDDWPLRGVSDRDRLAPVGCGILLCNGDPSYFNRLRDGRIEMLIGYDFRECALQAVYTAVRLIEDSNRGVFAAELSVQPEIITAKDLPLWEARWAAWRTGNVPPQATTLPQGG